MRVLIALAVLFAASTLHADECPDQKTASENARKHGFAQKKLTPKGLELASRYFFESNGRPIAGDANQGIFFHTSLYRITDKDKVIATKSVDLAGIMLFDKDGKCTASISGTTLQIKDILSGPYDEYDKAVK